MSSTRALPGAIVVGAVAVASMFAAAPASAATLPPGQKITVVDSWDYQFYNVNPVSALSTPVGTPDPTYTFVTGVDVDDTGLGYAIATDLYVPSLDALVEIADPYSSFVGAYVDGGYIYTSDANTGTLAKEKPVIIELGPGVEDDQWADECSAIDVTVGVILAVCYKYEWIEEDVPEIGLVDDDAAALILDGYWEPTAYIGSVDVSGAEAILTPLTTLEGKDFKYLSAIAKHPTSGVVYGFSLAKFGTFAGSWIVNLNDTNPTELDDDLDYAVDGADFDRSGQLWLSVSYLNSDDLTLAAVNPSPFQMLATYDFTDDEVDVIQPFGSEDPYFIGNPQSITIWGALAATGSTMSIAPAIAASGILLLGALMAAGTMVLRRRSADV
jgi:hypothetical protein